jgi:sulfur-oxidizing protein SoxY
MKGPLPMLVSSSEPMRLRRFTYVPNGAKRIRIEAKDTQGNVFQNEWKVDASGI